MLRVVLALFVLGFTVYTLVDCLQTPEDSVKAFPKPLWVFVVLLFPLIGGAAWFLAGRPKRPSLPPRGPGRRGPLGPDDDPDFLRGL